MKLARQQLQNLTHSLKMKRGKKWILQYECLGTQAAKRFKRGKKGPGMALPAMKWMMPITSSCTSCTGTMVHGRRIYHVKLFYDKDYPTNCQLFIHILRSA